MSDVSPPTDVPIMRLEERPGEVIDRTTSLSFSMERHSVAWLLRRHDRVGDRRLWSPGLVSQLQIQAAPGTPDRRLQRPQLFLSGEW